MFFEKPVGKHLIHFCKNASCMLRGSDSLLKNLCSKLNIEPGQTAEDEEFIRYAVGMYRACDEAPVDVSRGGSYWTFEGE